MSNDLEAQTRATMEGITLNLRVILDAFAEQGAQVESMRVIGFTWPCDP